MTTDLPLRFSTREIAYGALFVAYQLAPPAARERLRVSDAAFAALVDLRLIAAYVDRLAAACEEMVAAEDAARATLRFFPLHEALRLLYAPAEPPPPEATAGHAPLSSAST